MRHHFLPLAALLAVSSAGGSAAAAGGVEELVSGEVVSTHSRWTGDRSAIVTESVVRRQDGRLVHVRQLGGSIDGIGMVQSHMPAPLEPGERVVARAIERPSLGLFSLREVLSREPALPEGAIPFVRTHNKSDAALYWDRSCIFITYDAAGTTDIDGDREFGTLDRSFATWEEATRDCSFITFRFEAPAAHEVGFDRVNVVKFREDSWCRPATDKDPAECYDPAAAAITTLFYIDDASSNHNGEIVDADIEINAVNFAISIDGETKASPSLCKSDLANTATHEVGHLLGLDHTCWTGDTPHPTDDQGQPIPSCSPESQLPAKITEATMYNFQDCGETKKRTLEEDDIAGLCAAYPLADDPGVCRPETAGGCCSVAAPAGDARDRGTSAGWLLLAALIALALLRGPACSRTRRR